MSFDCAGVNLPFDFQTVIPSPVREPRFGMLRMILFPGSSFVIVLIGTPAIIEIRILPFTPFSLSAAFLKSWGLTAKI